jgi:F-type H+-transporting ATPase subunit b
MLKFPPDYTFLVQVAIFIALWVLLKRLWFDAALRIIRERTKRSAGAIEEARAIQAEAEQLRARHAAAMEEARAGAQRELQEMLREAEAEQQRLIADARADAQRTLAEARSRIAEEVTTARQQLRDSAHEIGRIVAQKVLGRPV